jgi:hypothetical protein
MVGDIIQDPLGGLVKGAVVAGSWAIGSAINAYKQNYDFVTEYGRDFLNGKFTTDDLVDVPPPPAEDLGTVVPDAPPSEGGQSSSGSSGKTFEELATELVQNEAKYGIQSPLGPEDPNFVSVPVPQQQSNKDPQAPLKPGFAPSPEPNIQGTPGANLILRFRHPGPPYPSPPSDSLIYYPTFRGQNGDARSLSKNGFDVFAIPTIVGGVVNWKVRVQAKANTATASTWELDAGTKPPGPGEVDIRLRITGMDIDESLLDYPPGSGATVKRYPLQQSAAPSLPPPPQNTFTSNSTGLMSSSIPSFSPNRPPWTSSLMDPPSESENLPGEGLLPKVPFPTYPSKPVVPSTAVPINPNNPVSNPAIGGNGLPLQNVAQIVQTGTDVHKIGDLAVNSGKIRNTTSAIAKEVGRIEQKTANIANSTGSLLDNLGDIADLIELINFIKDLLEAPLDPKTLTLNPVCESDKESTSVVLPSEKYTDRIQSTLDAIPVLLQAHLGYKTPTCGNEKPKLLGRWVTSRWLSDGDSPNGGRRLRKLFRYRTLSSRTNEELSEFWDGFTWQAGPTLVEHRGAWWGNPACWAVNETEGKRVIRNAAREAGLDPDMDGEWFVGSSRSPRFGMEGTMRLAKLGRWNHTVSRDGSDGYPADS